MIKKITKKKAIIVLIMIVAIAGLATASALWYQSSSPDPKYPGTTEQEKKETEDRKQQLIKENKIKTAPPSGDSTTVKPVTPVITTASKEGNQVVVTAYVPGIFEDGGTCTMKAINGSLSVNETVEGFGNVSTTNCPPFRLDQARFGSVGTWTVTVSYSSPTASGVSQPATLELQ